MVSGVTETYSGETKPWAAWSKKIKIAMHSSTAEGFELCPSDACQLEAQQQKGPDVCPIDGGSKFSPAKLSPVDPLIQKYLKMIQAEGIDLAGIEYVEDKNGIRYTYDINGTTNYNNQLGDEIGVHGMREVAKYIRREEPIALA